MHFTTLKDQELLKTLRSWHPLVADISPRLLLQIDHEHCRGNWREWSRFLAAYLKTYEKQRPVWPSPR